MIKILLSLLVLLSAFLFGYVLAKNTKEELRAGKKWFQLIILISIILIIALIFINQNLAMIFTLLYIIIVCLISIYKEKVNPKYKK